VFPIEEKIMIKKLLLFIIVIIIIIIIFISAQSGSYMKMDIKT